MVDLKIHHYYSCYFRTTIKHNVKFLDVQAALKGPDGYGKNQYFIDDNFHLTNQGHSAVKEYIKTHAIEEV